MKIVLIVFIIFSTNVWSQPGSGRKYKFFKDVKTFIKKPFELRDPFVKKSRVIITTRAKKKRFGSSFSNRKELYNVKLEELRIVGVFLGKKRKALAKVIKSGEATGTVELMPETYILKEGMRLGENRAEIKAILPGGIVLVERIKNVYDQDELLETIMPLYVEN
jgi:Tfp pilus assembly protein PilP